MRIDRKINWPVTILLLIASLLVLLPLFIAVNLSLKTVQQSAESVLALPDRLYFGNFADVFKKVHYLSGLRNSLVVTGISVLAVLVTSSMVGYAIGRNMDRGIFKAIYYLLVSGIFVPFHIIMLPLVKLLYHTNLNNFGGVILGYVFFGLSGNVFLIVGYLKSVSRELEESAIMDGAGVFVTFWRIIFPLLKPINATVAVFTMLGVWNDFLLPNLVIKSNEWMTLPLMQFAFQSQFNTNYNLAFASYLMALVPAVLFYLLSQRWIVSGLSSGAIKS